jgi:hypothetical protein
MARWLILVVCGSVIGFNLGLGYNIGSSWIASKGLNINDGVWNQAKCVAEYGENNE